MTDLALLTHTITQRSRDFGRGTAFPSSDIPGGALAAGDRFFRTDLLWPCVYDGTRWLTAFEQPITMAPYTPVVPGGAAYTGGSGVALAYAAPRTDYNCWAARTVIAYICNTNQSGTNYWTLQVQAGGTTLTTQHTQNATTAGNYYTREVALGSDVGAVSFLRLIVSAKNGAPGGLWASATLYARYVVT